MSPILYAKGVDLKTIIKMECGDNITLTKKSILLTNKEAKTVELKARKKLHSKIIRIYLINRAKKIVCYGIILTRRVRTKKSAILYMIDPKGKIKAIEILAFNEPSEFKPKKKWINTLKGKNINDPLRINQDIHTISGATLSARNVAEGARIALAIFDTVIKGKQ